jgi:arylsulfatase
MNKPNLLVILADDLGYSDLGCYGGEIRTPNLDALAADGLRFTQTYNSSRCCPSRASLLTGIYPHQAGIGLMTGKDQGVPGYRGRLNDQCVTLAEVLRPAGYATLACGKWHLKPGPIERGFDEFYGFVGGYGVNSWDSNMMVRLPQGRPQRGYAKGEFYAANAITDHALDFINTAREKHKPWLLYLAYQAPHFPLQAPASVIQKYIATYERGWDVLRADRLERMKQLGIVPANQSLPPRSPIDSFEAAKRIGSMTSDGCNPSWNSLEPKRRADLARRMAAYAAMVEVMDDNIGRVVASLREKGELDNTLILFLSDNGACAEWESFGFDLDPEKFRNSRPGQGIDVNTQKATNILHEGAALAAMGGSESLFSYGSAWANFCNTPFRMYKHFTHEGGIRSPLIAHWPARIAGKGEWRQNIAHITDIMATCVEVGQAAYPGASTNCDTPPMSGRSLLPAFRNEPEQPRTLVFEHENNIAIREGDWKLLAQNALTRDGFKPDVRWELYNLADDPSEQHNFAAMKPELVERLSRKFMEEARRTNILPKP